MNVHKVDTIFKKIGSSFRESLPRWGTSGFQIDVKTDKKTGEYFELQHGDPVEVIINEVRPDMNHLLMTVKAGDLVRKFLCGFDERHFFTAGVPVETINIPDAFHRLQPPEIQKVAKDLPRKERYKRHTSLYIRQGEWFFQPLSLKEMKKLATDFPKWEQMVIKNEPIQRGSSKAHMCQFMFRHGGRTVMVHSNYAPNGWDKKTYTAWQEKQRTLSSGNLVWMSGWRERQVGMRCLVKGTVRHPDHATVTLHGWHEVFMNAEVMTREMAFLD